eukprot:6195474-Pleurochrysis_carterae.AAC.1
MKAVRSAAWRHCSLLGKMPNFRGRAIDAKVSRSRESVAFMRRCAVPSCSSRVDTLAHGGTVIQRALRLCLHGVVVCFGSSWPCRCYNKIPFSHTRLTLRTTVVLATVSCKNRDEALQQTAGA